jgi:hypothetical protein
MNLEVLTGNDKVTSTWLIGRWCVMIYWSWGSHGMMKDFSHWMAFREQCPVVGISCWNYYTYRTYMVSPVQLQNYLEIDKPVGWQHKSQKCSKYSTSKCRVVPTAFGLLLSHPLTPAVSDKPTREVKVSKILNDYALPLLPLRCQRLGGQTVGASCRCWVSIFTKHNGAHITRNYSPFTSSRNQRRISVLCWKLYKLHRSMRNA